MANTQLVDLIKQSVIDGKFPVIDMNTLALKILITQPPQWTAPTSNDYALIQTKVDANDTATAAAVAALQAKVFTADPLLVARAASGNAAAAATLTAQIAAFDAANPPGGGNGNNGNGNGNGHGK